MSDAERLAAQLAGYVETWWQAIGDLTALLDALPEEAWAMPTDLAGWDVKAVASHAAHLESLLAGGPEETADIGDPPHVTGPMGQYTEIGVVARRDRSPASIIEEIRTTTAARHQTLLDDPPTDPAAPAPGIFGLIGWTQKTLLRNRPLDVWMHEQDVRRAVGRPGGMDSPAAQHTADYLSEAFGFVVGKKVAPPAGTTAVLAVEGSPVVAVEVDESGRGQRLADVPARPTARLAMDRETFIVLAGGRRAAAPGAVTIEGDPDLGAAIVAQLGATP
ncbi:maleylpyruvate isomerase family mycothiol-dependent enzyme [Nocardioides sp. HM23]|uniref:maleylpyruvate isomerase family mycothiol-dependent enzyme n=1 Tax=Nocardioides bizhenqiangii TaxID=3095076 RepID=UPI002ACA9B0E|nr:maleylpyruvate isomerase family mycothiol-dependent enzyme [Nocardioides sp. HM23]MDZ5619832.1 maleylpyruvate isomerase family mycothiol-dependent enzyme [Nocardioides sp. HM23]